MIATLASALMAKPRFEQGRRHAMKVPFPAASVYQPAAVGRLTAGKL